METNSVEALQKIATTPRKAGDRAEFLGRVPTRHNSLKFCLCFQSVVAIRR